jgi:hypothetical protein
MIRSFLAGSVVAFSLSAAEPEMKTLDVCDALKQRAELNGKLIAVQGIIDANEHGAFLKGERCPNRIVLDGIVWPSAVSMVYPSSGPFSVPCIEESILTPRAMKPALGPDDRKLRMVYVGEFQTRIAFDWFVQRDGTRRGNGFGPGAGFPAQLLYKRTLGCKILPLEEK